MATATTTKTKTKTTKKTTAKKATKKRATPKKNLVIVESPAKAKTIEKYLGRNYKVVASVGHIRDLKKSSMSIDFENNYEPQYINIRGKGPLINELKKEAKKAKQVFLASDPDREGEAISWHLSHILGLDPEDKRKVKAYSLGMKQKLVIAQAIFEQQKILLLDEPTNALDEESILKFRNILLRLKEKGCLIIIASHNKEDISILCDKVLKMDNGKLCQNEQ